MASQALRSCLTVALILTGTLPARGQTLLQREAAGCYDRVTLLLIQLADRASASQNLAFRVRAQAQAAELLWPRDRALSRVVFRRAFQSLLLSSASKEIAPGVEPKTAREPARASIAEAEAAQLRVELLNQIAGRDAELVEELAGALAAQASHADNSAFGAVNKGGREASIDGARGTTVREYAPRRTDSASPEAEQRELLITVALQIVERDPQRAMTLGEMSLGIADDSNAPQALLLPQNLARLLVLMRAADEALATLLFSAALTRLDHCQSCGLGDVHTLGTYVMALTNPGGNSVVERSLVTRFLNLAVSRLNAQGQTGLAGQSKRAPDDSSVYFVSRQLNDLFARYRPAQLPELQAKLAALLNGAAYDEIMDAGVAQPVAPGDIARQAADAPNEPERDSLRARAALAWLERGEVREALAAAARIGDGSIRDRVFIQVARRQTVDGDFDEAVAVSRRIEDERARAATLVRLAEAALSAGDRIRATQLLGEAEQNSSRLLGSMARTELLLTIVGSFSRFDELRAFQVMRTAVKSINEMLESAEKPGEPASRASRVESLTIDDVRGLGFESTLTVLARSDFDGALMLAQQLTGEEASLIAQLAVCRGGPPPSHARDDSLSDEQNGSGVRN
ncbi:MAG TPA: hypothetical protein VJH03_10685 [Blastocatellia bacterium]|nr:hypothetical protein [Blastocatellia bacterium]